MLEERTYTYAELSAMFGTRDNQGIQRRLNNMGIIFHTKGWGGGVTYEIQEITDPFKAFCILDLGFNSRTDFRKLRDFLFCFLNNEDFNWRPYEMMEEYLRTEGTSVSRQTISSYIRRLEANNLISLHGEAVYYKVCKKKRHPDPRDHHERGILLRMESLLEYERTWI